jgi:drug/metabolite transporter (DMT)-like permease
MPAPETTESLQDRFFQHVPLVVGILLVVDSLHFVFARLLRPYLPGVASALYVLAVATVEVGLFVGLRGRLRPALFRRHLAFFLSVGFLVAASTALNYVAVSYIDAGTASLLSKTSTLFALALGVFWLRERLTPPELVGALVAVAGAAVINFQPGANLHLGALMVLGSAFAYALHAAVVKRYGGEMSFENFFLFRVASTAGFLVLFAAARGELIWPSGEAWLLLALAGTTDVVISRTLYYLALRRLDLSYHAIILNLSPVITVLWSLVLFRERPTIQGFIGGAAVIAGVALVTWQRGRRAGRV